MAQKLSDIIPISNLNDYKAHCAVINKKYKVEPLKDFVNGYWNNWNEYKPKNDAFNKKYVFSMMRFYPEGKDIWLFGGIFEVKGIRLNSNNEEKYIIDQCDEASEYIGKLKLHCKKLNDNGVYMRQPRLHLKTIYDKIKVAEILPNIYTG